MLSNSAPNAITQVGTGGRIISEGETNRLRWNISNATGTYVVPFYDNDHVPVSTATDEIPLTVSIGVGGTAGVNNHIDFSTYDGGWDNATYLPTGVTNIASAWVPTANNSAKVIDRFWMLDANQTTKPAVTLSFTYIDDEYSVANNDIPDESELRAQRWNPTVNDWDGVAYPPAGVVNPIANTVSAVNPSAADFYKVWTLVERFTPLPIELISNEAFCNNKNVVIKWSTAAEINNNLFTIEKSVDGINFTTAGIVAGAGNSTNSLNYSFTDYNSFDGISYYRLKQTDYNGESKLFNVMTARNCNSVIESAINAFNNQKGSIEIVIDTELSGTYRATLFDVQGRKLSDKLLETTKGYNNFYMNISTVNAGVYFLTIDDTISITSKKIAVY